jgi:transposase InsO family protein
MQVSLSGYYAWRKRLTKPPCWKRKKLAELVRNCYFENRRRSGTRRIRAFLHKTGVGIGRFKVRRLMKEQGLKAIQPKSFQPQTTDSRGGVRAAPNLLAEVKSVECGFGNIIVGDITYIRLRNGRFCYLAVWQDKRTRKIISWNLSPMMTAELVVSAYKKRFVKG